ncbi:MAG TPA: DUF2207 domain-containing protein [Alphaproteobacteria bacterium]|nr:DUF2207 domain-containing protein [Alphaproteobacteria bacterium]
MAQRLFAPLHWLVCFAGMLFIASVAFAQSTEEGEGERGGGGSSGGMEEGGSGASGGGIAPRGPVGNLSYERILDYASRIEVRKDASVIVTETIRVVAAGRQIKRGIFRDLPLRYRTPNGARMRVDFKILDIKRDGKTEAYFTESRSNGIRIYIGRKSYFLPRGVYTYTIKYRMSRMIGFFDGFDEIYWNVTGNGWAFTIEQASATVVLPAGASVRQSMAYTGPQGARGTAYSKRPGAAPTEMVFRTTRRLRAREGLSVAVGFTKGIVEPPSGTTKMRWFFADNAPAILGLFGLVVLGIFYLVAWIRVGRDPAKGAIIPLYEPPKGISPAAARFIRRMGFDNKAFAAAVVNMAVKGYLTIDEDKKKTFTLNRIDEDKSKLTKGERDIAKKLFRSKSKIKLEQANHSKISGALNELKAYLRLEFEKAYFLTNRGYFFAGLGLTVLAVVIALATAEDVFPAIFLGFWLSVWTIGVFFLGMQAWKSWRSGSYVMGVVMTLFFLPFFAGEVAGAVGLGQLIDWVGVAAILAMGLMNAVFFHLMRAPTRMGRKVMDQLEGFRMYLSVAEKDRMNLMNPPAETPELFEKFLPYALALDVEQKWSERFADVLKAARMADGTPYHPYWYHGHSWSALGATGLASGLGGAFSGAISSSSTAPGSSSGSGGGGGGSSGGGGGGGGGGGW